MEPVGAYVGGGPGGPLSTQYRIVAGFERRTIDRRSSPVR